MLLVDDHRLVAEGFGCILSRAGLEVVGHASDGRSAVELAVEKRPDVVLMDVSMPEMDGLEATRAIGARAPDVRVLMLSMYAEPRFISESVRSGARGYVLKEAPASELLAAIDAVCRGGTFLSARAAEIALCDADEGDTHDLDAKVLDALTPREREVLTLIAEGCTSGEIAEALHIGVRTVDTHRQHVMRKLGVRTIAGLTKLALRVGLTSLR